MGINVYKYLTFKLLCLIFFWIMLWKNNSSYAQKTEDKSKQEMTVLADGLGFPEGPIAMPDGSVILVEMEKGTLTKVKSDGSKSIIAQLGGGPNGAAIGPDGAIYVCNNGGLQWSKRNGVLIPGEAALDYKGGYIQRVDSKTGKVSIIYTECDGRKLSAPNDIVFDAEGGMWFSDQGKYFNTYKEHGALYYAKIDGSFISRQAEKLDTPNGIRLSIDGKKVYYAETSTGRIWYYNLLKTGQLDLASRKLLIGLGGHQLFDSFALDAKGNICAATLINGGISVISSEGTLLQHIPTSDMLTTSICFLGNTAYITLGGTGKLASIPWVSAGHKLNFFKN